MLAQIFFSWFWTVEMTRGLQVAAFGCPLYDASADAGARTPHNIPILGQGSVVGLENSWDKGRNRRRLVEEALTNVNIRSSPRHQKQSTDARVFRYVFYLLHLHRYLKSRSALIKLFLVCLCMCLVNKYLFFTIKTCLR